MRELYKQSIKFLYYGFLAMAFVLVLLFASNKLAEMFGKQNQWDSLAFVGAIIGGSLTLIGVRITLNNQEKHDYLNRLPQMRRAADNVISETDRVVYMMDNMDGWDLWGGFDDVIKNLEDFTGRSVQILERAAEVSEDTYIKTRDFNNKTIQFILSFKYFRLDDVIKDERFHQFHHELKDLYTEIKEQVNNETTRYSKKHS